MEKTKKLGKKLAAYSLAAGAVGLAGTATTQATPMFYDNGGAGWFDARAHFGGTTGGYDMILFKLDGTVLVDDAAIELLEPSHHLFADSLADLLAAFDNVPDHQQDESAGPKTAEMSVPLNQRHIGAGAFRCQCRDDAGRPAPNHQHICLVQQGQLPLRLDHLAVDDRRGRVIRTFDSDSLGCVGSTRRIRPNRCWRDRAAKPRGQT